MHELGTMFYLGDGLPVDEEEAVRWFRQAAVRGVSSSMYLLGECLLEGEGTRKDREAAFGWFAAAAELGHRGARQRVLSHYLAPGAHSEANADEWSEWMHDRYHSAAGRKGSQWTASTSTSEIDYKSDTSRRRGRSRGRRIRRAGSVFQIGSR